MIVCTEFAIKCNVLVSVNSNVKASSLKTYDAFVKRLTKVYFEKQYFDTIRIHTSRPDIFLQKYSSEQGVAVEST